MNASAAASRRYSARAATNRDGVAVETGQEWIQSSLSEDELQALMGDEAITSQRVWQGFMTARVMVAFLLLALHALGFYFNRDGPVWQLVLCAAYLVAMLGTRLLITPVAPGKRFEWCWPVTLGLDLLVYFLLVWFKQSAMVNYMPLLVLPPVMSAVLGTKRITILTVVTSSALIGVVSWRYYRGDDLDNQILHYAVMLLYMLIMFLVTSILQRAARNYGLQQSQAHVGRRLLRLQGRIQDMVVQSVRDGVLVVSGSGRVRAINQAAQQMLHMPQDMPVMGKPLKAIAQILPLQHLIKQSFAEGGG